MPNHLAHLMLIEGGIDIASLYGTAHEEDKRPAYMQNIDFNKIIPTPPHIFQGDLSSADEEKYGVHNCWYQWNVANWGTKWNSYDCKAHSNYLIEFQTAWSPPIRIFEALSMLHPEVKFTILWKDEGADAIHEEIYYDGASQSSLIIDHSPNLEYDEEGEEVGDGHDWDFITYSLKRFNKEVTAA